MGAICEFRAVLADCLGPTVHVSFSDGRLSLRWDSPLSQTSKFSECKITNDPDSCVFLDNSWANRIQRRVAAGWFAALGTRVAFNQISRTTRPQSPGTGRPREQRCSTMNKRSKRCWF
jgi:hypothetical protein